MGFGVTYYRRHGRPSGSASGPGAGGLLLWRKKTARDRKLARPGHQGISERPHRHARLTDRIEQRRRHTTLGSDLYGLQGAAAVGLEPLSSLWRSDRRGAAQAARLNRGLQRPFSPIALPIPRVASRW